MYGSYYFEVTRKTNNIFFKELAEKPYPLTPLQTVGEEESDTNNNNSDSLTRSTHDNRLRQWSAASLRKGDVVLAIIICSCSAGY